jgi:hypothetical protein
VAGDNDTFSGGGTPGRNGRGRLDGQWTARDRPLWLLDFMLGRGQLPGGWRLEVGALISHQARAVPVFGARHVARTIPITALQHVTWSEKPRDFRVRGLFSLSSTRLLTYPVSYVPLQRVWGYRIHKRSILTLLINHLFNVGFRKRSCSLAHYIQSHPSFGHKQSVSYASILSHHLYDTHHHYD